jgi:MFS transporter, DHA2 family, multidrug resistance protein
VSEPIDRIGDRHSGHHRWLATATMMLGTAATVLATTIINVAIPDIMSLFALSQDRAQWLATGFLAGMSATMLMTTWCVRRFGQRGTYIGALSLFLVASLVGGMATRADVLIVSRIVQGGAGGIIQPLAMVTIFTVFPAHQRGRAMGIYGLGVVLAPAIGPAVGGWLVQQFGWRALFLLSVPFCLAGLVMAPLYVLGRSPTDMRPRFDWGGLALFAPAFGCLLYALNASHRAGWLAWDTLGTLSAAAATGAVFVWWERNTADPMLDLGVFSSRAFAGAALVALAYGLGVYGSTYLVPLLAQTVAGYTPAQAGALLTPPGIALAIVLPVCGWLTDRIAPRSMITTGLILFACSALLLARHQPVTPFWVLALYLTIGRIGLGMIIPALNTGAMLALSGAHIGQGSSVINFIRQLGGALGVNVLATFLEWRTQVHAPGAIHAPLPARVAAFHESFVLVGAIFVLAVVPGWLMRVDRRR